MSKQVDELRKVLNYTLHGAVVDYRVSPQDVACAIVSTLGITREMVSRLVQESHRVEMERVGAYNALMGPAAALTTLLDLAGE